MIGQYGLQYWVVLWDGKPFQKGFVGEQGRKDAEAFAERWQGQRYKSGMLKHGDKKDYFEVKRDYQAEKELLARLDEQKRGNPQKIIMQQRVED